MMFTEMQRMVLAKMEADPGADGSAMEISALSLHLTQRQARALIKRLFLVINEFEDDPAAAADATPAVEGLAEGTDGDPVIYSTLFALAPLSP